MPAPLPVSLDLDKAIRLDVAGTARSCLVCEGLIAVRGANLELVVAFVVVAVNDDDDDDVGFGL